MSFSPRGPSRLSADDLNVNSSSSSNGGATDEKKKDKRDRSLSSERRKLVASSSVPVLSTRPKIVSEEKTIVNYSSLSQTPALEPYQDIPIVDETDQDSFHDEDYFGSWSVIRKGDSIDDDAESLRHINVSLERTMSLFDAISIVVGDIIGTGIFMSPGGVLGASGSVGLSLIVWIGAGLLSMLGGFCYSELAAAIPRAGGDYVYFTKAFGKMPGFMYVWIRFFILNSGSTAVLAIVFSHYLGSIAYSTIADGSASGSGIREENDIVLKGIAISSIVVLTAINCWGVRWGMAVQRVLFVTKIGAMLFVVGLAIYSVATGSTTSVAKENFTTPFGTGVSFTSFVSALGVGTMSALWAYDGWIDIVMVAEEVKSPGRNIPRSIIFGCVIVIVAFLVMNLAYLCVLPAADIVASQAIGVLVATRVIASSKVGAYIMSIAVALSALGTMNGTILSGGRVFFAAGRDSNFPLISNYMCKLSKNGTPWVSLTLQGIMSVILVLPGSFGSLVDYFGFASWSIYGFAGLTLIYLRFREPEIPRPFKIKPFPYMPMFYSFVAFSVCIALFVKQYRPSGAALGFILLSIPVYFIFISDHPICVYLRKRVVKRWRRIKRCLCCCNNSRTKNESTTKGGDDDSNYTVQ